jgi:AraC-like DNA-binding protein
MNQLETVSHFSTQALPREKRLAGWSHAIESLYGKFVTEPGPKPFVARLDLHCIGDLIAVRSLHNARSARRTLWEIGQTDPRCYFVILQLSGSCEVEQSPHKTVLLSGDMTLLDSRQPCNFTYPEDSAQFTLFVPLSVLDSVGFFHRSALAMPLRGAPAALIGSMLRISFGTAHPWTPAQEKSIADAITNLVVATWGCAQEAKTAKAPLISPFVGIIQSYILNHLQSRELRPAKIAAAHNLSVRHLHRMFSSTGTTIAYWIRRARLDRCATDLLDEASLSQSVTHIGYRWGFNDSAHFCRIFKAEFGLSPLQYRCSRLANRPVDGRGIALQN